MEDVQELMGIRKKQKLDPSAAESEKAARIGGSTLVDPELNSHCIDFWI